MNLFAREIALKILIDIERAGAYSNISIGNHIKDNMNKQDEGLIREIVYGVLDNQIYIDYIISKASKIRIKKIHLTILQILRMGIYQLIFMDRIPSSAAVNESVNLAKKYGHKGTIGYVNGILRNIARNKEEFMKIDVEEKNKYLSIKYSYPLWIIDRWIEEFGEEFTEELCEAGNKKPNLNIRVNTLKITKIELKSLLKEKGLIVRDGIYAEDALILENPYRITELEEFKKGYFTIQDESSILVGQIMNPSPNSTVLDVCSAPGGKSTHMAQLMGNTGRVLSRDIFEHKVNLIKENAMRLGIRIIESEIGDATLKDESLLDTIDYCLVDAPCSGFGLIRRKPDIKWNRKEEDIGELAELQFKILENVKDYVKVGGILLYSTCTIENEENLQLINRFLTENPNFKLTNIEGLMQKTANIATLNKGYIQLYPHIHNTDGFFIAKMIKER